MVTMVDEDTPADGNEGRPPLISLRLPAALLASLDDESRLSIDHGTAGSVGDGENDSADAVGPSLTIAAGGTRDVHQLEVAASEQPTEYYQSASTAEGANGSRELRSIGKTNKQYTLKPKSAADLKEIGKKTRRLLEEERKKRKEIVRLDESDDLPLPEKGKAGGKKPPPVEDGEAPPKKTGRATANPRKRKRQIPSTVDGWMPDVDELMAAATTKGDRSNIVRLHGLPVGAKPEHVRKFFDGLNPSLIFVLPSFDCHIQGWDADCDAGEKNEAVVRRYPSNFRVFAEFTSVLVAEAAIERSGESMGFDAPGATSEKQGFVGASISLSPVPKGVAAFLHDHMAIHTLKGELIDNTMKNSERRMGEVAKMSWQMAKKRLKLKRHLKDKSANSLNDLSQEYATPKDRSQHIELVKTYNQLIDTHERLELNSSVLLTHTFDPSLLEDSVHRVTRAVSEWLLDEIDILARVLKESRLRLGI